MTESTLYSRSEERLRENGGSPSEGPGGRALSGTKKVTRLDNRHHVTSDNVHEKCGDVSGDSHVIEQSEEKEGLSPWV